MNGQLHGPAPVLTGTNSIYCSVRSLGGAQSRFGRFRGKLLPLLVIKTRLSGLPTRTPVTVPNLVLCFSESCHFSAKPGCGPFLVPFVFKKMLGDLNCH